MELQHSRAGNPHLSARVEDVDAKYEELARRGDVPIRSAIVTQEYQDIGARTFYVTDPDGVQVEFVERLYDYTSRGPGAPDAKPISESQPASF